MDDVRKRLLADAFLYDDPESYIAGIDAVLAALDLAAGTAGGPADPALMLQEMTPA